MKVETLKLRAIAAVAQGVEPPTAVIVVVWFVNGRNVTVSLIEMVFSVKSTVLFMPNSYGVAEDPPFLAFICFSVTRSNNV